MSHTAWRVSTVLGDRTCQCSDTGRSRGIGVEQVVFGSEVAPGTPAASKAASKVQTASQQNAPNEFPL